MTIGEMLKHKDIYTYNKLMNMFKIKEPKKKIELGCSVGELMRVDSYKREGRRVKQRGWS